jgi:hypothetical protein
MPGEERINEGAGGRRPCAGYLHHQESTQHDFQTWPMWPLWAHRYSWSPLIIECDPQHFYNTSLAYPVQQVKQQKYRDEGMDKASADTQNESIRDSLLRCVSFMSCMISGIVVYSVNIWLHDTVVDAQGNLTNHAPYGILQSAIRKGGLHFSYSYTIFFADFGTQC